MKKTHKVKLSAWQFIHAKDHTLSRYSEPITVENSRIAARVSQKNIWPCLDFREAIVSEGPVPHLIIPQITTGIKLPVVPLWRPGDLFSFDGPGVPKRITRRILAVRPLRCADAGETEAVAEGWWSPWDRSPTSALFKWRNIWFETYPDYPWAESWQWGVELEA